MRRKTKNQHLGMLSIRPQMPFSTFEAESIAFVCCERYGIDSSQYSFPYLVGWSSGRALPELTQNLEIIQETAWKMIQKIDSHLAETVKMDEESETHGYEMAEAIREDFPREERRAETGGIVTGRDTEKADIIHHGRGR